MSDPDAKEDKLISQVNIDKFLNSTEESDSDDALWELSQDDIDTLMNSDPFDSEEDIDTDEDDDDMELISQDDIDNLMNLNTSDSEDDEGPENSTEPVILDEESTSDSKEKIDLKESDEDVSQEDIDALLLDDDDLLISQDDIDTLLMAVDQEDEDVLGDLVDEDSDDGIDDGIDDEDDEDDEDGYEEYILKNDEDQVILEDDDSEEVADTESKTKWYKSKLIIVCASALISIGIIVPAVYYLLFYGDSSQTKDTMEQYAVEGLREIEIEIVDSNVGIEGNINSAGNMVLKNFVILASDLSEEMAYITTDVSIDYSDQRAYHEIQNNLSFYRDLIYSSINESLASGKHDKITEADILWKIEKTLKKVLPGTYIDRVSFKSFRAS